TTKPNLTPRIDHISDDHINDHLSMMSNPFQQAKRQAPLGQKTTGRPYTIHFGQDVAPVRRTLGALTRRVHQISMALTADSLAGAGITPVQYGAMGCLNRQDGEPGIDQIGLAARLGVDRNSTSLLVDDLAKKGLIERRVNDADRRARLLRLTSEGERLFHQVRKRNLAAQGLILETLAPDERELLLDLLTRVIAAKGVHARPGAGRRKRGSQILPVDTRG
ncbi:MAG: MarR family transcriptional regulator, partial [Xanthobacteraceae bacterium]